MRYLVIHKNKRLHSPQDEKVALIKGRALTQEEKGYSIREYGPLLGWFLSLFHIAFKAIDSHGKGVWLNRHSFCNMLIGTKKKSLNVDHALEIFQKEIKEASYSRPDGTPDLNTLYEAMSHELTQEIDRLESEYFQTK